MGKQISREVEKLIEAGKKAGRKAREENFALGLPIHIIENGKLIAVYKDGNKTVLRDIETDSNEQ